ncbi:hypothetical protein WA158_008467 [Blastocystis sp. Blastoise]
MKSLLILVFFIVAIYGDELLYYQFNTYATMYGKVYSSIKEKEYRMLIFQQNLDYIEQQNTLDHTYTLGLTIFADMTNDEYKASRFLSGIIRKNLRSQHSVSHSNSVPIPSSIDWRTLGVVNPIKNQLSCGSCWAFSAISAVESLIAIKTGQLNIYSEQQVVDCDKNSGGCFGGFMTNAFTYMIHNGGICSEEEYPYQGIDQTCKDKQCSPVATIQKYADVQVNSGSSLVDILSKQPVSVAVDASSPEFQLYKSGTLNTDTCGTQLNHGVTAIGYNLEANPPYLIIRNSWGTEWGDHGYIHIKYESEGAGMCGVNKMASYPIL